MTLRLRFVLASAMLAAASASSAQTLLLVRHGEKQVAPVDNPGLSIEGKARSDALLVSLAGARIDSILTTDLRRTIETAEPLARATKLDPQVIEIGKSLDAHVREIVARIRSAPAEATIVVVGHSNTVPLIIAGLGYDRPVSIRDCEFDKLFVMQVAQSRPTLVEARYGAPSDCDG